MALSYLDFVSFQRIGPLVGTSFSMSFFPYTHPLCQSWYHTSSCYPYYVQRGSLITKVYMSWIINKANRKSLENKVCYGFGVLYAFKRVCIISSSSPVTNLQTMEAAMRVFWRELLCLNFSLLLRKWTDTFPMKIYWWSTGIQKSTHHHLWLGKCKS